MLGFSKAGWGQITQVTGSPQTNTSTSNNLLITKPSGIAVGDVMIANIMHNDNDSRTLANASCSGWTVIDGRRIYEYYEWDD